MIVNQKDERLGKWEKIYIQSIGTVDLPPSMTKGHMFQDPQLMPEIAGSAKPYIYYVFS